MNSNLHLVESSPKGNSKMQKKCVSWSKSKLSVPCLPSWKTPEHVYEVASLAEIVALDHNYCLPRVAEVVIPNPVKEQPALCLDDSMEKMARIEKLNKPVTDKIIVNEEEDDPTHMEESSVPISYLFHIKPELQPKNVAVTNRSSMLLSKSSMASTSPTMSKLESLLKNECRSSSPHISRRSPSSFLSPSLNYHRCKKSDPEISSTTDETENDKDSDTDIDVEKVDDDPVPVYDSNKANSLMKDCEKYLNILRPTNVPADWEEQIVKTGWTNSQRNIFEAVLKALHQERLSRLVNQNCYGEPVLRRLSIDKTSQRIRKVLGSYRWNTTLTQWLHGVLVENLSFEYLSAYFDVLQTLRVILPDLVDKMIVLTTGLPGENLNSLALNIADNPDTLSSVGAATISSLEEAKKRSIKAEAINLMLKRKWDPFNSVIQHCKTKKQPNSPIFVFIAAYPIKPQSVLNQRKKRLVSLLAGRGKVISVTLNMTAPVHIRLQYYMGKLLRVATQRVRDLKRQYPGRPVFAVGWTSGSVLASKLSTIEQVAGVINIGLPMRDLFRRESLALSALQSDSPSLLIIGELTNYTSILDMECLSHDMNKTSLLIIGCASDALCISNKYRKRLLVTQPYVDNSIVDEILKFVSKYQGQVPDVDANALSVVASTSKAKKKAYKLSANSGVAAEVSADDKNEKNKTVCTTNVVEEEGKTVMVFDFDGPAVIPSNTSSSKRKAYFRPTPPVTSCAEKSATPVPCITASQLVQQSPGVKKRYSKPSGPNVQKPANQVDVKPVSTSPIQVCSSIQGQQQSSIMSSGNTDVGQSQPTIPKSVILNLVSTPSQVLRVDQGPKRLLSPEIPAPTRFNFPPEESISVSDNLDQGTEAAQPISFPSEDKQTLKVLSEHSEQSVDAGTIARLHEPSDLTSENKQTIDDATKWTKDSLVTRIDTCPSQTPVLPLENKIITEDATETKTPLPASSALLAEKEQVIEDGTKNSLDPGPKTSISEHSVLSLEKKPTREDACEQSVTKTPDLEPTGLPLQSKEIVKDVSEHSVDSGPKIQFPQLPVAVLQTKEIIKDATEDPGSSKDDEELVVIAQIRPPTKVCIDTAMITAPTILPGGATATPYIRTTLPAVVASSQQQRTQSLSRRLAPSHGSINLQPSVSETPKYTRCNEDLNFVTAPKYGPGFPTTSSSSRIMELSAGTKLATNARSYHSVSEPTKTGSPAQLSLEKEKIILGTCYSQKEMIANEVNLNATDKAKNDSDDEVQILTELPPSDPLLLSPSDIEDAGINDDSLIKPRTPKSTGQIELANKKSTKVAAVNVGEKVDKKGNKEKSYGKGDVTSVVFQEAVKRTYEVKGLSTDGKSRNELGAGIKETKGKISEQSSSPVRTRKSSSSDVKSNDFKKTESSEFSQSAGKAKPGKIKASVSTKRVASKSEKHCANDPTFEEDEDDDPPTKITRTRQSSGTNSVSVLSKSANVAVKTASKFAMKAQVFFEKNKILQSDSPASRTRNRSGGSTNPTITGATSQKSKATPSKKRSRLRIKDDSENSDSSCELAEEVKPKQRGRPASLKKKKNIILSSPSSSAESECSSDSSDEPEDKEIVPRVTRSSMKRQSVPGKPH